MKLTAKQQTALFNDYARLVSSSAVETLKKRGHDRIEAERGGAGFTDASGHTLIDCYAGGGVFNLGRQPEEALDAVRDAARRADQGNFPMISDQKASLGEKIASFVPGALECSVFGVMRGEAFDFACKLARGFTGRPRLIAVDGSWFGETGFPMSLSERPDKDLFGPLLPETAIVPFGDVDAAKEAIDRKTAAVFLELVQAENGCRTADAAYVKALAAAARKAGALLVIDETQTGFGRTGSRFCFEQYGIDPDVILLGEALGAGAFPITATVFTQRLNSFMNDHPLIHLSTFGGSDLGCLVAARVLELYEENAPWENAAAAGARLGDGLARIAGEKGSPVKSAHGRGLLWAVELAAEDAADAFCKRLADAGVFAVPGKVAKNTVVLRPPLTITEEQVDAIVDGVRRAAGNDGARKKK